MVGTVPSCYHALGVVHDDMITPVTSLGGAELVRARESTLGETLAHQPGITSSHFGAGASRPVIRGMDGPRVKILSDGAEIQDASTISSTDGNRQIRWQPGPERGLRSERQHRRCREHSR